HRPDVLHIDEEPYNLGTFLAARAASVRGIPSLFFTWQNLVRAYPLPFRWMEKFVYGHSAWAIAGNQAAEDVLRRKGFRGPCTVLPQFGVDPALFTPVPNETGRKQSFTVGFAGRLVPEKGVSTLVEACAGLNGDFRLLVVGQGPERTNIEALMQ